YSSVMSKIFYFAADDKIHGPFDEIQAQTRYTEGFFSSGVKFKVFMARTSIDAVYRFPRPIDAFLTNVSSPLVNTSPIIRHYIYIYI
ncbi:hypothetical protein PFISCL1PPCAC_25549, partial [Pristionchus fissidentatus]